MEKEKGDRWRRETDGEGRLVEKEKGDRWKGREAKKGGRNCSCYQYVTSRGWQRMSVFFFLLLFVSTFHLCVCVCVCVCCVFVVCLCVCAFRDAVF